MGLLGAGPSPGDARPSLSGVVGGRFPAVRRRRSRKAEAVVTESAVADYHRLTSFSLGPRGLERATRDPRLVADFVPLDPDRRPPEVKAYGPGPTTVDLPGDVPHLGMPAGEALSGGAPATGALDLAGLARLLFFSGGVVRYLETPSFGRLHFRAAGSAGNLHPLEVYAVARGVAGLPEGVWHHDPLHHRLHRVNAAPAAGPSYLVVTGVPWRTGWKYAERGYRHLWWDAGTMCSQVLALAHSAGIPARLRLGFPDGEVAALVGADQVHELALAVVVLGEEAPDLSPAEEATAGVIAPGPTEFPLVTDTHRASAAAPAWGREDAPPAPASGVSPGDPPPTPPLEEVILARGSTRRFDPGATLPAEAAGWAMAVATCPLPWDVGETLGEHHLLVHAVEGVRPGRYRWGEEGLVAARTGDVRAMATQLCLGQGLAGDAGYVAVHCCDLEGVIARRGERAYRAALFEAGVVEGRLHLAAFALGRG
ncbi:MAG TPA: nitroreductase family protein, partial [Acidimicrobiales bacterium]|nr:nitroreductase family protein [Acidimicrobiales bacterium]